MICEICKKEYNSNSSLSKHITKDHNISKQEYYDKYYKKENAGICLTCGQPTRFNNIILGYFLHCSAKCSRHDPEVIEKTENTTLKKYGSKNIRNTNYYKEKSDKTKLEKYGDKNYNNREKAKITSIEKYGVENPIQNKEIEQKRNKENMYLYGTDNFKKNLVEKYGSENYRNLERAKETNLEKYGVENPFAAEEIKEKIKTTLIEQYGVENPSQNSYILEKRKNTCIDKYGVTNTLEATEVKQKIKNTNLIRYNAENPFASEIIRNKIKDTNIERYGAISPLKNEKIRNKIKDTNIERYGYENPMQNPDIRKKQQYRYNFDRQSFDSSWEIAYYIWLIDHSIEFEYQPNIRFEYEYNNVKHYYYPDFLVENKLQELKGLQFFENKDINSKMINPFDRSMDELYEAKHQCMLKNNVQIITDCTEYINYVNEKYTKDFIPLFKNNLEFPYPDNDIIKKYHHSIYAAHREYNISPIDAWQDKNLIYKCALNRLKYIGSCKPSDILQGFNVAKIAPKVSVFKRTLAKRLINEYLNEFNCIFDPFSGFSGRMLGAVDCNKCYIGQDINQIHVNESNNIINDLNLNAQVICKDIFNSNGIYDCLFTCPPYNLKEQWNEHETNLTCDEWIDICLQNFKCKKYLFVVDTTEKYKNNIVETIGNKSHFGSNNEYVILIENSN